MHIAGRDEFFRLQKDSKSSQIQRIVNNIFFHIQPLNDRYPLRNFAQNVLARFREQIAIDWNKKYKESIIGFETLVELPRTGEVYKRDGWTEVGQTIGYTCKRVAGKGTDSWTGKRVWNTTELRPKRVFCRNL